MQDARPYLNSALERGLGICSVAAKSRVCQKRGFCLCLSICLVALKSAARTAFCAASHLTDSASLRAVLPCSRKNQNAYLKTMPDLVKSICSGSTFSNDLKTSLPTAFSSASCAVFGCCCSSCCIAISKNPSPIDI